MSFEWDARMHSTWFLLTTPVRDDEWLATFLCLTLQGVWLKCNLFCNLTLSNKRFQSNYYLFKSTLSTPLIPQAVLSKIYLLRFESTIPYNYELHTPLNKKVFYCSHGHHKEPKRHNYLLENIWSSGLSNEQGSIQQNSNFRTWCQFHKYQTLHFSFWRFPAYPWITSRNRL